MERRGSGIRKMMEACENDEKKPKFEVKYDAFVVTFYSRLYKNAGVKEKNEYEKEKNEYEKVLKEIYEKYPDLKKTTIQILQEIIKNKNITQEEFSKKFNKSKSTFYRGIRILRGLGIIERIGSDKKGYWKIKL